MRGSTIPNFERKTLNRSSSVTLVRVDRYCQGKMPAKYGALKWFDVRSGCRISQVHAGCRTHGRHLIGNSGFLQC